MVAPVVLCRLLRSLLASACLGLAPAAFACVYPDHPVTLIVPFPAGGSLDATMRVIAAGVERYLGSRVVVSNVSGGSGVIGTRQLLGRPHDGCWIVAGSVNTLVAVPSLNADAGYRVSDFVVVGDAGSTPAAVIARPGFPASGLDDLPAAEKTLGRPLAVGHPGNETLQYLYARQVESATHLRFIQVPYKGSAQIVPDVLGGHIDMAVVAMPAARALQARGQIKIVATLGGEPWLNAWAGWFMARGTPPASLRRMRLAFHAAMNQPEVRTQLDQLGVAAPTTLEQLRFAEQIVDDSRRVSAMIHGLAKPGS